MDGTFLSLCKANPPKKRCTFGFRFCGFFIGFKSARILSLGLVIWPKAKVNVGTRNCFLHLSSYSNGVICQKQTDKKRELKNCNDKKESLFLKSRHNSQISH